MKLVLAAEIPSIQNGGLAADGKSVTWKLKPGVKWHDGKPFTADDVVFNWEYARDPATATVTIGVHRDITVEKVDDLTVRILFNKPTPFWADAFVGAPGAIIPKHLFADYKGAKSREAPEQPRHLSAPAPTNSSSSSRAISSAASSIPTTTCRTAPTSTRSR